MTFMNETPLTDLNSRRAPMNTPPSQSAGRRTPARADLTVVLGQCGPIPRAAAFLGLALDGLPVLLNLRDPSPGPLLVVGDPGSGKRRLLQVVARSSDLAHPAGEISHAVLTDHPREWEAFGLSPRCEGILTFHHPLTARYVSSLVQLARTGTSSGPYLLLIVDGLEALASDRETQEDMLWLLENGPARCIWPIVAVTTPQTAVLAAWLKPFRTVLCGRTSGVPAGLPAEGPAYDSSRALASGAQFAMLSGDEWLPFWVPEPL